MLKRLNLSQTGLLTGSFAFLGSSLVIFGLRFVTGAIVARSLGAQGKGVYALFVTTSALLALTMNLGLGGALTYLRARGEFEGRPLGGFALSAALTLALPGAALLSLGYAAGLQVTLLNGLTWPHIILLMFFLPIDLTAAFFNALLLGERKIFAVNFINVTQASANLALQTVSWWLDGGVNGAIWAWLLANVWGCAATLSLCRHNLSSQIGLPGNIRKPALNYGLKSYIANLFSFFNYRLDSYLVNFYAGSNSLGQYSTGVSTAELLWYLPNAVSGALFPKVPGLSGRAAAELTARAARQTLTLLLLAAVPFAVLGAALIPIIYGTEFRPAVTPFLLLLPGIIGMTVSKLLSAGLSGQGKPQYATQTTLVTVLITIGLDVSLIPQLGIAGAALASSAAYLSSALLITFWFCRETGLRWQDVWVARREDLQTLDRAARAGLRRLRVFLRPRVTRPPQLQMTLPLEGARLTMPALPPGYRFAPDPLQQRAAWISLLNRSGEFLIFDETRFEREIQNDLLPEGGALIYYEDTPVACAAACHKAAYAPNATLMYVVVDAAHRGHQLGTLVSQAAICAAQRAGYPAITLFTDDIRLPAIRTYLKLGFQPQPTPQTVARWQNILRALQS